VAILFAKHAYLKQIELNYLGQICMNTLSPRLSAVNDMYSVLVGSEKLHLNASKSSDPCSNTPRFHTPHPSPLPKEEREFLLPFGEKVRMRGNLSWVYSIDWYDLLKTKNTAAPTAVPQPVHRLNAPRRLSRYRFRDRLPSPADNHSASCLTYEYYGCF